MASKKEKKMGKNQSGKGKWGTSGAQKIMNVALGMIMIIGILSTALGGRFLARQKPAQPTPVQAEDLNQVILSWQRGNNGSGTCDELLITLGGTAKAENCSGNNTVALGTQELAQDQLQQLQDWVNRYQSFAIRPTGTPVPDRFDLHLVFQGSGSKAIDEAGLQQIERFVEAVFGKLANEPLPDNSGKGS
jgi:hypothetical protein